MLDREDAERKAREFTTSLMPYLKRILQGSAQDSYDAAREAILTHVVDEQSYGAFCGGFIRLTATFTRAGMQKPADAIWGLQQSGMREDHPLLAAGRAVAADLNGDSPAPFIRLMMEHSDPKHGAEFLLHVVKLSRDAYQRMVARGAYPS